MSPKKLPEDPFPTPRSEDRPAGSWPRRIEDQVRLTAGKVDEIHEALIGSFEKRGLIRDVEDLKQAEQSRKAWYFVTVGAAVTSVISAVIGWLSGGHASK